MSSSPRFITRSGALVTKGDLVGLQLQAVRVTSRWIKWQRTLRVTIYVPDDQKEYFRPRRLAALARGEAHRKMWSTWGTKIARTGQRETRRVDSWTDQGVAHIYVFERVIEDTF